MPRQGDVHRQSEREPKPASRRAQHRRRDPAPFGKLHRLDENLGALHVQLTEADLEQINDAASKLPTEDARLPEAALKLTGR